MDIIIPAQAQALYENGPTIEITHYPHPLLRMKAEPIRRINEDTQRLIAKMARILEASNGVGLAAPQIGVSKRLILIHPPDEPLKILINPVITHFSEEKNIYIEGCLSLPALYGDVERPAKITVEGLNRKGKKVRFELEDYPARIAQHEIDHLDGILFIDRADASTLHWSFPDNDEAYQEEEMTEVKR